MKNKKSLILVMSAAVLWGIIGVFFKMLSAQGLSEMQIVAVRVILSAVIFPLVLLPKNKQLLKIDFKDIWIFIGTGIVSLVCFNWCYFTSINAGSLSVAAVLLYTAPAFVMIMSAFLFKEKITPVKVCALIATLAGCVLVAGITGEAGRVSAYAVITGLGAGLGYALYSIFGKYALAKYKSETVTAWTFIAGAVGVLPVSGLWRAGAALLKPEVIIGGLGISVLCCILPYMLYTKGLEGMEAGSASVAATIEPVVAAAFGIFVYGDSASLSKIAGIILIIGSVAAMNIGKSRK